MTPTAESRRSLVCPILVGRDDLLELTDRRIAQVVAGRGQLLCIAGEAGVGKSRLAATVERRAAAAGMRTVRSGTYPSDLQVQAAVLVDLARALARTPPFEAIGTQLTARLDDRSDHVPADTTRRRRLFVQDVVELLTALPDEGPVLIVLEDLHWADDLTLEIIEALARRLSALPMLVLATYRTHELSPQVPIRDWRVRVLTQRLAEEVRLRRLTPEETGAMVTLLLGTGPGIGSDAGAAVHERTDGIPLHVEEFVAILAATDLSTSTAILAADAPATVKDAILTRLADRSPGALRVAEAAAVIGRSFDVDLLATVLAEDPDALSSALTELADHHIVVPTATPGRLGFRHAIICDAIYDHIDVPRRRRLHDRTATAASDRTDVGTPAFLSIQFERAGRAADANAAALAGAHAATAMSSHREAYELYRRAVRTAALDPSVERARLLEAYAQSCAATDRNEEAAEAFESARLAYLAVGRSLEAAAVVVPLVAARHLLGDSLDERVARLTAALDGMDHVDPGTAQPDGPDGPDAETVRARLLAALAAAYMLDRRLDESIGYATDARRLARTVGDRPTERNAAASLGSCLVFAGRMDEGWALLEATIEDALAEGAEAEAARAYRMLGSSASVLLDYERAERWLRAGLVYAERVEQWNHRNYMAAHLAHVLWATGRWDEAGSVAAASLADGRGGATTRVTASYVLGYLALGRGDIAGARAALAEALELGVRMRELQRVSPALWGLAELAACDGDPATAIGRCRDGLAASAEVGDAAYLFPFAVTGVRACLEAGDPRGAQGWLAEVEALIARRAIPGTDIAVGHARSLLEAADGASGRARAGLEAAIAGWDSLGRVWEGTWARIDLARTELRSNRRRDADRIAGAARDRADALGSVPLQQAADAILRRRGRSGAEPEPWAPLTAREFEVARLAADGLTNARIADELGIAPKTASAHIEHILAKLGVDRRVEIAGWVARRSLVLHSGPHGRDREE